MKIVDPDQMRKIERDAQEIFGLDEALIIENVGVRGSDFLVKRFLSHQSFGEIVFLIGSGNNGADAFAIARHLVNRGYKCRAFELIEDGPYSQQNRIQARMAEMYGVKVTQAYKTEDLETYFSQTQSEYLVVDGILGTGLRLPLSNYLFDIIELVNRFSSQTISLDIASGVCGRSGNISSTCIKALVTLAIGLPKTGHYLSYGAECTGELVVLRVGIPKSLLKSSDKTLLNYKVIKDIYFARDRFAHKNDFGHSLIVGGSQGLTGALLMASKAALKSGTGLVSAATWPQNYGELTSRVLPEIMTGIIPTEKEEVSDIINELSRYDSIVLGPGLGRFKKAKKCVSALLNSFSGPIVIDADAIRVLDLEEELETFQQRKAPTIFTPHMGEFADLIKTPIQEVLDRPLYFLKNFVDQTNSCLILKGACTYIGFPNGEIFINYFPNDGLASGGSGDVLAGMIGGVLAQYIPRKQANGIFEDNEKIYQAICLAVSCHSLAGKYAAKKYGVRAMTAGSIISCLPEAFAELDQLKDNRI